MILVPSGFSAAFSYREDYLMAQVSVEEVQRDVSAYLQRVEAGETLVIVRAGKPVAEITPVVRRAETLRPFGLCAGEFTIPDDFDAPLPENILKEFEGQ
jgi:prevent-host-death family protein